jgi:hypothetical protein
MRGLGWAEGRSPTILCLSCGVGLRAEERSRHSAEYGGRANPTYGADALAGMPIGAIHHAGSVRWGTYPRTLARVATCARRLPATGRWIQHPAEIQEARTDR